MNKTLKVLSLSAFLLLTGCSSEEPKEYSMSLDNKEFCLIEDYKDSETINISTLCNGATYSGGKFTFTSSDNNVVTVSETGTLSFAGCGKAKVEAKWEIDNNTYSDYVTVDCYSKVSLENINTFSSSYLNLQGRTYITSDRLVLDNTATGMDLAFVGTELKFTAKGNNTTSYIHVYVDDDKEGTIINIDSSTDKEFTICSGLTDGFHKVRIIKATSSLYGRIFIKNFSDGVAYFKAPKKDLTFEFLGDSISCGYGNLGEPQIAASASNEDAGQAFPYLTSSALDANFSVLAYEGICAKDGNTNIYDSYTKASLVDSKVTYDCASYSADVVVIGLAENDMWHATDSDFDYTIKQFRQDYAALIKLVRSYHPTSHIVCMYGMMQASSTASTKGTIQKAIELSEDTNISELRVSMNANGSETHPNVAGHKDFTEKLTAHIQEQLQK